MNLNEFLNSGIMGILNRASAFYIDDKKGRAFILRAVPALMRDMKTRARHERDGLHVPPFLIASVASECNLRCAGCYARATDGCGVRGDELTPTDWRRIFAEADELGVSFILLAGGEPLLKPDILKVAAEFPRVICPVFTNGTLIDDACADFLDAHRNLIPVVSLEGGDARTDARRGAGVADMVRAATDLLSARGILYGASITVTRENMLEVTEPGFARALREKGCGLAFYVEYVPAEENTGHLVLTPDDLEALATRIEHIRDLGMIVVSFPGDEEKMGGCLAAGRGFFHINASGGAEPCPFSPFAAMNLREHALADVLRSDFFAAVREIGAAEAANHAGGCALFRHRDKVSAFIG